MTVMLTSGQPQLNENNAVAAALNADCTEVHEIGSVDVPENNLPSNSKESKRTHGGRRRWQEAEYREALARRCEAYDGGRSPSRYRRARRLFTTCWRMGAGP